VIEAEFYSRETDRPLQQGDIIITGGVTRVGFAGNAHTPYAWSHFSDHRFDFAPTMPGLPGLSSISGRALVMVVSHDCHLDKELNTFARHLMRTRELSEEDAFRAAEDDDSLDRHVVVSPIVRVSDLTALDDRDGQGQIRSGRRIGYLPLADSSRLGIAESVADLGYRSTVDRFTLTERLVSLSDDARIHLRYALARMDSLRTPDIGAELDLAVGQRVLRVERPQGKRMAIVLHLGDGSTLELLPRPGSPNLDGPRRRIAPST
jgi:hypothetical protein